MNTDFSATLRELMRKLPSPKSERQSGARAGSAKMGNVHLKWAFSEAAVLFLCHTKDGKRLLAAIEKKHGKRKASRLRARSPPVECI